MAHFMKETTTEIFDTVDLTTIGIYAGSLAELNKIDLSFLNLQFNKIGSQELLTFTEKAYDKSLPDRFENYIAEFQKEKFGNELYVLHPINLESEIDPEIFIEIQNVFLIMFPSDFRLFSEVHCQLFNKKILFPNGHTVWPFKYSGDRLFDNFMDFNADRYSDEISNFLKLYFERVRSINYLKITIPSYINSFFQDHTHMAYVSLCISLESITNGRNELIYRIRRNCAILNSPDQTTAWTIFKNVDKLYAIRSTIVHGDKYDIEKVEKYYPILQALVSRTIIELVLFNFKTIDELNNKLTETGFGNKYSMLDSYSDYVLNRSTQAKCTTAIE